ncbi:MAG: VWA domain-containing protein [Spirochaetaceae bacterium]|jgi:Ca-activated chloride channel family protein|nr:VWA domain-containing protein [Spirochaetaceae bacterium]
MGFPRVEAPGFLFLLVLILPAALLGVRRLRALSRHFAVPPRLWGSLALGCASFAFLVIGLAGPSWGVRPAVVPRSGGALSFVFDISWSMTAPDGAPGAEGLTRLDAARLYAKNLLRRLEAGTPVSVVIAKGDGVLSVPLTADTAQAESFLEALSPRLLSAPGTSLGRGIKTALGAFPRDFAFRQAIVLFTDGDETDGTLREAALEAVRSGVSVYFAGFGGTDEVDVLSGDGETRVPTALRKDKLLALAQEATQGAELKGYPGLPFGESRFFEAAERGSALRLLEALRADSDAAGAVELRRVSRHKLFLALALGCFAGGILFKQGKPAGIS